MSMLKTKGWFQTIQEKWSFFIKDIHQKIEDIEATFPDWNIEELGGGYFMVSKEYPDLWGRPVLILMNEIPMQVYTYVHHQSKQRLISFDDFYNEEDYKIYWEDFEGEYFVSLLLNRKGEILSQPEMYEIFSEETIEEIKIQYDRFIKLLENQ